MIKSGQLFQFEFVCPGEDCGHKQILNISINIDRGYNSGAYINVLCNECWRGSTLSINCDNELLGNMPGSDEPRLP